MSFSMMGVALACLQSLSVMVGGRVAGCSSCPRFGTISSPNRSCSVAVFDLTYHFGHFLYAHKQTQKVSADDKSCVKIRTAR